MQYATTGLQCKVRLWSKLQKIRDLTLFAQVVAKTAVSGNFKLLFCRPKVRAARAARLFFLVQPIKFLVCGTDVAIDIINAKAP